MSAEGKLKYLPDIGRALAALLVSALVLVLLYAANYQLRLPSAQSGTRLSIVGNRFGAVMGAAQPDGDALVVTALAPQQGENRGLFSVHEVFPAAHYPYLRYRLAGWQPALQAQLFWRTAEHPEGMFFAPLPGSGASTVHLAALPGWQGTITDLALYFGGDLRAQPLRIIGITLEPPGWRHLLAATWSEWTAFRGWKPDSINHLRATFTPPGPGTLSPTVAIASWVALALLFLYILNRFRPGASIVSYGAAMLIPWIVVDQLWQSELSTQLQQTRQLFAGKTTPEKHLVDVDRDIYNYTRRLQEEVLPSTPSRIFMLHASTGHNFERLKTQYYLLPHNIYNFGSEPLPASLRPGDFILALGTIAGLKYNERKKRLLWRDNRLPVNIVDRSARGTLYRVRPTADRPARPGQQQERPHG